MAYIVVNSTALEDSQKEIMSKFDELTRHLKRLETRLCVFMEFNGVNPREIPVQEKSKSSPAKDSPYHPLT